MKYIDITGQKFGRLLVKKRLKNHIKPNGSSLVVYSCECECGSKTKVISADLRYGYTRSCGCLRKDVTTSRSIKHGFSKRGVYNQFYWTFQGILSRCKSHPNYAGRGIKCFWDSFDGFKRDMYKSYLKHIAVHGEKNTTIDRVNNNGGYSKENCRWATYTIQMRNQRKNVLLEFRGETKCITEWEKELGFGRSVVWQRIKKLHWDIERSLTTPSKVFSLR